MTASPTYDLASAERRIQELTKELSQARGELAEAREQQATTAAILAAIPNSATDRSGVFAEIAASAARLCDAYDATIFQVDGGFLRTVAHHGPIPQSSTLPLIRGFITGRVVLERQTIHIADVQAQTDEYPDGSASARQLGHRTIVAVPLIHDGEAIGVIAIRRNEARPFTDRQIDLLKSFADQAVIAIENTRLFEAEKARTRELMESLEYQTATSEILRVISSSPTDVQPTFDAIAKSARRLCEAAHGMVFRFDGELIHLVAHDNLDPEQLAAVGSVFPIPPGRGSITARAILTRTLVHLEDRSQDPELDYKILSANFPTTLSVPLIRDGIALGAITVTRAEVALFSERQVELLKTFADQAVIAIENTRLFEAEQVSKRELQESLEYQTAISEVLGVISRAPSELQPVLNAIVATARGLCDAERAVVWQIDEDQFRPIAFSGMDTLGIEKIAHHRLPIGSGSVLGRAANECRAVQVLDAALDNTLSSAQNELARAGNIHSILAVPLMRDGRPSGCLSVSRTVVQSFSDRQVALLETFADQAVIAIENTHLFEAEQASKRELTEALEQQTATADVLKVISRSALDLQKKYSMHWSSPQRAYVTPMTPRSFRWKATIFFALSLTMDRSLA
jgi:GAF domain-containing protein